MALEQWEIDLRKQLEGNKSPTIQTPDLCEVEKPVVVSVPYVTDVDWPLYASVIVFFLLAGLFLLDFKTDFINKILSPQNQAVKEFKNIEEEKEVTRDEIGADKATEIMERLHRHEEKLFLLGIIVNENAVIAKNNCNKKDILTMTKDWKLGKYPKHIIISGKDKEYLDKIQNQ